MSTTDKTLENLHQDIEKLKNVLIQYISLQAGVLPHLIMRDMLDCLETIHKEKDQWI